MTDLARLATTVECQDYDLDEGAWRIGDDNMAFYVSAEEAHRIAQSIQDARQDAMRKGCQHFHITETGCPDCSWIKENPRVDS